MLCYLVRAIKHRKLDFETSLRGRLAALLVHGGLVKAGLSCSLLFKLLNLLQFLLCVSDHILALIELAQA
jgi:hypothetical protein